MKVIEKKKLWFSLSIAIIVIGLIMGMVQGFNLGIDFTGGTMMQIHLGKEVAVDEVKQITSKFDLKADILHVGEEKQEIMIKTKKDLDNNARQEIFEAFKEKYNLKDNDLRAAEQFGPSIGKEIQSKALLSVAIASLGMLIYITFRFEFKFGASAIITLIHDILVVLAIFAIFRIPVNSSFVAAMLTIVGYSINDTIVVFDRIRENIKFMKKKNYTEIVDTSINQTIRRSINTSLTTLITITALYIFGVESIREFALPLVAGIITGTYSSIFIASPIWVSWKNWEVRRGRYDAN
ncbi:protein translocase subunit SecF [Marinisporobacter balticus]|uniref:Protein-export membrane protein SecF n=1 Tax=Marinisporobacter balticus TaxID=2018667 RepID=A0A4R2L0B8_9FIRM|nr:protein translocase subunit SecF [Marinisporobacter balticus]TCO79844.1 protein translocase subunit secF [Marinisporobacter balticus]